MNEEWLVLVMAVAACGIIAVNEYQRTELVEMVKGSMQRYDECVEIVERGRGQLDKAIKNTGDCLDVVDECLATVIHGGVTRE